MGIYNSIMDNTIMDIHNAIRDIYDQGIFRIWFPQWVKFVDKTLVFI